MPIRLGIALGDATGIGAEVTLKALAEAEAEALAPSARFLLLGDLGLLKAERDRLGLELPLVSSQESDGTDRIRVENPTGHSVSESLEQGGKEAAWLGLQWLEAGAKRCLAGDLDGLITAPVNKHAILEVAPDFVGQTEWLSAMAGTPRTAMMLLGEHAPEQWLRVALVTTHKPLAEVAAAITTAKVAEVIALTAEACRRLGCARSRIAVCGLNPHAGEEGSLGREEIEVIAPAVREMADQGYDVHGPLAADTLFYDAYHAKFDAVIAMYHDQGLAPLKMVAFDSGVNWTLGLPFVRTSPDHGTAYSLVGQNKANPSSMKAAIRLAFQLARTEEGEEKS